MTGNGAGGTQPEVRSSSRSFGGRPIRPKASAVAVTVFILITIAVVLVFNVALGIESAIVSGAVAGAIVGGFSSPIYRSLYDRLEVG